MLLWLALLPLSTLHATPAFVHRSWATGKGLPQSSVTAIAQGPDGYLWLATFRGLARFDGLSFTVFDFSNTPELKSNRLRALYADTRGALCIGTEHAGLTEYRAGTFHPMGTDSNSAIFYAKNPRASVFNSTQRVG